MFTVYDSKTGVYSQPNFLINKGAALRAWAEVANDKSSNIGKYPADHTFFLIGQWDDETGMVEMYGAKENLGTAIEFVRDTDPSPIETSQIAQIRQITEQQRQEQQ